MALIRCYDCGKEISSLATACPSCGAPPRPSTIPPPLPTQAARAKKFSSGTIALLTGVVLALVIRGMTHQPKSVPVAKSPTPEATEAKTTNSPLVETPSQSPPTVATAETPTSATSTTGSSPVEAALQSSQSVVTGETPTSESSTTISQPVQVASKNSPSPASAETPYAPDVSTATESSPQDTYQVTGIPVNDYLNVREGAGLNFEVVTKLEPGERGIMLGTKRVTKDATTWQQITVHGQTGWVNAAYIGLVNQAPTSPAESSTIP